MMAGTDGRFASYDGSGYILDFDQVWDPDASQAAKGVKELEVLLIGQPAYHASDNTLFRRHRDTLTSRRGQSLSNLCCMVSTLICSSG